LSKDQVSVTSLDSQTKIMTTLSKMMLMICLVRK